MALGWRSRMLILALLLAPSLAEGAVKLPLLAVGVPIEHRQKDEPNHQDDRTASVNQQEPFPHLEAYSTGVIAGFTVVLAAVGIFQGFIIWRQLKLGRDGFVLARQEFDATHRPKIIMRDVFYADNKITFLLVNAGDGPAIIKESWFLAEWVSPTSTPTNMLSAGHDDLGLIALNPGEPRYFDCETPSGVWMYANFGRTIGHMGLSEDQRGMQLHFAGCILYQDRNGNSRRSVFRRIYAWEGGFRRSDNPDHEYAD